MTKSLTEKWKDGELECGLYYVKTKKDAPLFCGEITEMSLEEEITISQDEKVEEVLAPVPSYDEYKRLVSNSDDSVTKCHQFEKKLEIATKALKDMPEMSRAQRALREMEGVK